MASIQLVAERPAITLEARGLTSVAACRGLVARHHVISPSKRCRSRGEVVPGPAAPPLLFCVPDRRSWSSSATTNRCGPWSRPYSASGRDPCCRRPDTRSSRSDPGRRSTARRPGQAQGWRCRWRSSCTRLEWWRRGSAAIESGRSRRRRRCHSGSRGACVRRVRHFHPRVTQPAIHRPVRSAATALWAAYDAKISHMSARSRGGTVLARCVATSAAR